MTDVARTAEPFDDRIYVPGTWRCPKCDITLTQCNLNGATGTVTARDQPGDKCPNCKSPLWRVTYRDAYAEVLTRFEQYVKRERSRAAMQPSTEVGAVYSYAKQPGNVEAWRLGEACSAASKDSAGDYIDRGLNLLHRLAAKGFAVIKIEGV